MTAERATRQGELLAGKYQLGDVIGAGGMGVVYEATHTELRTKCAVKVVDPERDDRAQSKRLLREARALAALTGPYAVRVLDAGYSADGAPFLVMERLTGEPLSEVLQRSGALPWPDAVDIAWQISAAIREAHGHGIIHRDLKPSNVFALGQGRIKVLDFGLATRAGAAGDDSTTTGSEFVGSPRYMSPEQIRSSTEVTRSTDVWSLGVLLFEMLTARLPFGGANTAALLASIVADPAARLRELLPTLPPDLDCLIADCLEKHPGDRPAVENVQARLERLLELAPAASPARPVRVGPALATRDAHPTLSGSDTQKAPRPIPWPMRAAALAGLALLALFSGVAAWRSQSKPALMVAPQAPLEGPPTAAGIASSSAESIAALASALPPATTAPKPATSAHVANRSPQARATAAKILEAIKTRH